MMKIVEIQLNKQLKHDFYNLVKFLSKDEYNVMSSDGGETYMFIDKETNRTAYQVLWSDLCINYVPKKLGLDYLIIPMNSEFNIIKYLLDIYKEKSERVEEIITNPFALDGTH